MEDRRTWVTLRGHLDDDDDDVVATDSNCRDKVYCVPLMDTMEKMENSQLMTCALYFH